MSSYLENKRGIDEAIENYSRTCVGKRLKAIALASIALSAGLLLAIAFLLEDLSQAVKLIMRGLAGVCAIVFVISTGILLYKSNCSVWSSKG